jgi:type IV pilus assembly protein PilV
MISQLNLQRGFSLVEVMVAAVVFSVGLGGLSIMLLTSVHGTVEAHNETTAAMQAASLAELILMNPAATGHYIHPPADLPADCLSVESCSDASWAYGNLRRWQQELEQNLARATGLVCQDSTPDDGYSSEPGCDQTGPVVVKVFWDEPHHREEEAGGKRSIALSLLD